MVIESNLYKRCFDKYELLNEFNLVEVSFPKLLTNNTVTTDSSVRKPLLVSKEFISMYFGEKDPLKEFSAEQCVEIINLVMDKIENENIDDLIFSWCSSFEKYLHINNFKVKRSNKESKAFNGRNIYSKSSKADNIDRLSSSREYYEKNIKTFVYFQTGTYDINNLYDPINGEYIGRLKLPFGTTREYDLFHIHHIKHVNNKSCNVFTNINLNSSLRYSVMTKDVLTELAITVAVSPNTHNIIHKKFPTLSLKDWIEFNYKLPYSLRTRDNWNECANMFSIDKTYDEVIGFLNFTPEDDLSRYYRKF